MSSSARNFSVCLIIHSLAFLTRNVNDSTFGAISAISPKEDAATKRLEELLHSHPELPDLQPEWILGAKAAVKEIEDRGASGAGDAQAQCLGRRNSATDGKRRH